MDTAEYFQNDLLLLRFRRPHFRS